MFFRLERERPSELRATKRRRPVDARGKPVSVRRFSKLGGQSCGRVCSCCSSKPSMAFPRSVSVNRPSPPKAVGGGGGGGGRRKTDPPLSGEAPECPRNDARDLARPNGRPGFELTPLLAEQLRRPRVGPLRSRVLPG